MCWPTCSLGGMEELEVRHVLSALVDIVFALDESKSQAVHQEEKGESLRPWVSRIVEELEERLVGRGIGANASNPNRFGVVTFGDDAVRTLRINDQVFATAEDFDLFLEEFTNHGGSEDGWEPITQILGINNQDSEYAFRDGAAVHIILVSDEGRQAPTRIGSIASNDNPLFFEILKEFHHDSREHVGAPILTTVAPYFFDEAEMFAEFEFSNEFPYEEFQPTIMGIDANILDSINLDANRLDPQKDIVQSSAPDDVVLFTHHSRESIFESEGEVQFIVDPLRRIGSRATRTILDDEVSYSDIRTAFMNPCRPESICVPQQYQSEAKNHDVVRSVVGQDAFDAEDYAFLTWEGRGTAWDFNVIRSAFNGWDDPQDHDSFGSWVAAAAENFDDFERSDSLIRSFNRAFVDDVFEKTRLQVADFDRSNQVAIVDRSDAGSGGDFVEFFSAAHAFLTDPERVSDPARFDLDNDGQFVDRIDAQIDKDDLLILNQLFASPVGDANLDFQFNSTDFVRVFQAGEYEDGIENNSTWLTGDWNGDFDFDSSDFVAAFQSSRFELGYQDNDVDGHFDLLPIWAWQERFEGVEDFYRPAWRDT